MPSEHLQVHAVILAGGRGTRFWPRSRTKTPKQLLNIVGKGTMLEQTVERLLPLAPAARIWTVTNAEQQSAVRKQLPKDSRKRVLVEPMGRNTAAAIALAAFHIQHFAKGDALMAVLPADHYIAKTRKYQEIVEAALHVAREPGHMVVLGIPPTRPETGFGYIELEMAREYLASGNYQWNAGMFFWRVSTILDELKKYLPQTFDVLQKLAAHIGTRKYAAQLRKVYPKLENISVDYAILERVTQAAARPQVFVIPAEVGWSDIGSWEAVYELQAKLSGENIYGIAGHFIDSSGNFVSSTGKFIAAIGVNNLVVVETPDALLICPRDRAQDVGKVVKWLEERKLKNLI